ncbi:rhamnogalacturonan acetylesterase [Asticcacaulis sp. BYS171W]|uniref:Rhamnogalacturonan acetylesterase n=1 Tax=Asticcacaulis aquaticus TaxID=2984212 RepID=A0ABT5HQM0_9CAUL|nr:rhamnogalacturonan acetylesterase [Asticcacaulis aquaticus]MDC7682365.1 rhamnogalacturonan acetylesterase [Asticcacaulis aquaticus]
MSSFVRRRLLQLTAATTVIASSSWAEVKDKPALFLIGDSTVRNGREDNGATGGQFGWGRMMKYYFDTSRLHVVNDAMGGTSSRSFQTSPDLWAKVVPMIRPGDYVMMAFGHNDSKGSLKGNGDETGPLTDKAGKVIEGVHSYGWYMREYIRQVRAKGAVPIVVSLIPRNRWTGDKVNRNDTDYALWAQQAAEQEKALFIPLNGMIADRYDVIGQAKVTADFFPPKEDVHPNWAGAAFNAALVIDGLTRLNTPLKKYLIRSPKVPATPDIVPPAVGEPGPSGMRPSERAPVY